MTTDNPSPPPDIHQHTTVLIPPRLDFQPGNDDVSPNLSPRTPPDANSGENTGMLSSPIVLARRSPRGGEVAQLAQSLVPELRISRKREREVSLEPSTPQAVSIVRTLSLFTFPSFPLPL